MLEAIHGSDLIVLSSHPFFSEEKRTPKLMHLMAKGRRVFFFHQPIIGMTKKATVYYNKIMHEVTVVQPYLPDGVDQDKAMMKLMRDFVRDEKLNHLTVWTDTAASLPLINHLNPEHIVFDKSSLQSLEEGELELLRRASVVLSPKYDEEKLFDEISILNADHSEPFYLSDSQSMVGYKHVEPLLNRGFIVSKYQNH